MKKKLFGQWGDSIKGNAVLVILSLCVVGAGALSFYTINDINTKLKNQTQNTPINSVVTPAPTQQPDKEANNTAENVPLTTDTKPTASPKPSASPSASPKADSSSETETAEKFILPVNGKIFNSYSGDELVYNKTMGDWRTHNGIDISATQDTAVKASLSGKVSAVYEDGILGHVVEIESENVTIRYCGLDKNIYVKQGDTVKQGDSIGAVGEIPLEVTDESHIHIEFLKDGVYQDPNKYLS